MHKLKRLTEDNKRPVTQFELTKNIVTNLKQFNLTPAAKLVLILLTTHYNTNNGAVVFPSMPFISDTLGIGLTATKQAIKDLINQGLIVKAKRDHISGNYNKYILTLKVQNVTAEQPKNDISKKANSGLLLLTNKREQIKEQTEEDNLKVSNDDITKLKQYAVKMGAKNVVAYTKTLINNGSYKVIIDNIKQAENASLNAQKRIEETKQLLDNYEKTKCYEPIPEYIKKRAEELKNKMRMKKYGI